MDREDQFDRIFVRFERDPGLMQLVLIDMDASNGSPGDDEEYFDNPIFVDAPFDGKRTEDKHQNQNVAHRFDLGSNVVERENKNDKQDDQHHGHKIIFAGLPDGAITFVDQECFEPDSCQDQQAQRNI